MTKLDFDILNELDNVGNEAYKLIVELFPICKSITGERVKKSLKFWNNIFFNSITKHFKMLYCIHRMS